MRSFKRLWGDLSVAHKLYTVVGIMAVLIATELFTLLFAMNTLSAMRALVGGESLWSKAQKNAILELLNYSRTHREEDYANFRKNIRIPLGDHQARIEMMKPVVDVELVKQGFIIGEIHPNDVLPVINLLMRFHSNSYIQQAIQIWGHGDDMLFELIAVADRLHQTVAKESEDPAKAAINIAQLTAQIGLINSQVTELESQFSFVLGEASRWLEKLLMILLVIAVATVEATGLTLTILFSRNLTRVLGELHAYATQVGRGDFTGQVPVRSADELGRLAMALNKMSADLNEIAGERHMAERANQVKNLFLANMSHEIRTPLNAILGFVELLKEPSLTDKDKNRYLEVIERTGHGLATIINDILDISKVEAGKLEVEKTPTSLAQMLRDLEMLLSFRCEVKGIDLKFEVPQSLPDFILTDPTRFKQVLLNIIGNAIKFTDRGGVYVSFAARNEKLICNIRDTGVGISPEDATLLFRPFSQADLSIRKRFGGTGLGLVLSRRLARLLGGDVVLSESRLGKGTQFQVSFALEAVDPDNITSPSIVVPPGEVSLRGKRILLVEDSLDNQLLATQFLSREGAEVEIANHGEEAISAAAKTHFDLVLMDMQMPIMDGYSATFKLRQLGLKIPIIALTAHAMKEDLQKCLSVGCTGYLSKPFRREGLIKIITRYCRAA